MMTETVTTGRHEQSHPPKPLVVKPANVAAADRSATADPILDFSTPFTGFLARYGLWMMVAVGVLLVLPFNGQWRIGLDSSLYRGVAESLAAGRGYTFAGYPQTQIYPGLVFLLVAFIKLTGSNSVLPVLLLMNLIAIVTLWLTYKLIRTHYPVWIAVVVTCGVGLNEKFVLQAHEVMTDTPFLLGCVMTMLGWEYLGRARSEPRPIAGGLLLGGGLLLAALMRPTFWVLALALVVTCLINVLRRREKRSVIAIGVLAAVFITFVALDPRVRGWNFLKGGYEREFMSMAGNIAARVVKNAPSLFMVEIPEAMFNDQLWYFGPAMSIVILVGAAIVTFRHPFWGSQVFILTGVMLLLSDVPRYYVMVLPAVWLGYVLLLVRVVRRIPAPYCDHILFAMFTLANVINIGSVIGLVRDQHRADFLSHYRGGDYVPLVAMADLLRDRVPPDAVVIGPYANILAYLSDRRVIGTKQFNFDESKVTRFPAVVAFYTNTPDTKLYMVGPPSDYVDKDKNLHRLILAGVIRPLALVDHLRNLPGKEKGRDMWIATAEVVVPAVAWQTLPKVRPTVLSAQAAKVINSGRTPEEEVARRELKARRERKAIRAAREERAERNRRKEIRRKRQEAAGATK